MIVVDLDIINGSSNATAVPCLKLLKEAGAKIIHKEDLWNGFKKSEVVNINLQLVMRSYSGYVDGIYFDGTPAALTPIFGEVRDPIKALYPSFFTEKFLRSPKDP